MGSFLIIEDSLFWDGNGDSLVADIDLHFLEVLEVTDSRACAATGHHQAAIADEDQNDKIEIDRA